MAGRALVGVLAALCALLVALPESHAVDFSFGACGDKEVVQSFDVARYAGHWYEVQAFWQIFELGGKCSQAEYTVNGTGRVTVKNTMVDVRSQQEKSIEGHAELANPSASPAEAKLTVTFNIPESAWILSRTPDVTDQDAQQAIEAAITKAGLNRKSFLKTTQDCGLLS